MSDYSRAELGATRLPVGPHPVDPDLPMRSGHPKVGGRPYWQTKDCPKWCRQKHFNHDVHSDDPGGPGDRFHFSDSFGVELTMSEPYKVGGDIEDVVPERFDAELFQGYREVEPHITLGLRHGHFGARLTLKEAERLAFILGELTNIAHDASEWNAVAEELDGEERQS